MGRLVCNLLVCCIAAYLYATRVCMRQCKPFQLVDKCIMVMCCAASPEALSSNSTLTILTDYLALLLRRTGGVLKVVRFIIIRKVV